MKAALEDTFIGPMASPSFGQELGTQELLTIPDSW